MGRLLLVDLGEDEERFEQFMLPLASTKLLPHFVDNDLKCSF